MQFVERVSSAFRSRQAQLSRRRSCGDLSPRLVLRVDEHISTIDEERASSWQNPAEKEARFLFSELFQTRHHD